MLTSEFINEVILKLATVRGGEQVFDVCGKKVFTYVNTELKEIKTIAPRYGIVYAIWTNEWYIQITIPYFYPQMQGKNIPRVESYHIVFDRDLIKTVDREIKNLPKFSNFIRKILGLKYNQVEYKGFCNMELEFHGNFNQFQDDVMVIML